MTQAAPDPLSTRFTPVLAALTLLGLFIRTWNLAHQPGLGDDWAAGMSAITFVERGEVSGLMWQHPRLRDLLVYASSAVLGQTKLGVSLPSVVLGVASIPLVALLARRIAGPGAGLVAAALVALDPVHVLFSRQAVQDVHEFAFATAGVLLAIGHVSTGRRRSLLLAGLAFGLGIASRWVIAAPAAVTAAWVIARHVRPGAPAGRAARVAFTVAALAALPAAVYLLTWTPWLLHGRDLSDWVGLQRAMWAEVQIHQGFNPATRAYPDSALEWFLWPVWWADFTAGPRGHVVFVAVTNPLVWLLTLPAIVLQGRRARRERRPEDALVVTLFAATWLPLVALSRPVFLNASLATLPFAIVSVAALVARLAGAATGALRRLGGAYVAAVALTSAPLLLLATGAATDLAPFRAVIERFRPEARFEGLAAPGARP